MDGRPCYRPDLLCQQCGERNSAHEAEGDHPFLPPRVELTSDEWRALWEDFEPDREHPRPFGHVGMSLYEEEMPL